MTLKTEVVTGCIILLTGFGLGVITVIHFSTPKTITVETQHDVIHNNIVTVTHTIKENDGTVDVTTTTTDHSQKIETDSKTAVQIQPNWLVSGTYGIDIHTLQPAYGLQVNRRILGPVFIGALLNTRGDVGLSLGFEF